MHIIRWKHINWFKLRKGTHIHFLNRGNLPIIIPDVHITRFPSLKTEITVSTLLSKLFGYDVHTMKHQCACIRKQLAFDKASGSAGWGSCRSLHVCTRRFIAAVFNLTFHQLITFYYTQNWCV